MDGTDSNVQIVTAYYSFNTGCVNLRAEKRLVTPFFVLDCENKKARHVCKSALRCGPGSSPCPVGWLALDSYCYHYVSIGKTWQDADIHCSGLKRGARLSPVINMSTWHILYQNFGPAPAIRVGISYQAPEQSFQAIDGSAWSVTWVDGEPDGVEGCVRMTADGAEVGPCEETLPFICRDRVTLC